MEGVGEIITSKWDSVEFIVLLLEKFDGIDWWYLTLVGSFPLHVKWDK